MGGQVEWGGQRKVKAAARRNGADPFGIDPALRDRVKPFLRLLYKYYWRVEVEGIENVPADGPVLLAANHSGALPFDAVMIALAVEEEHPAHRMVRMLYAKFVDTLPAIGTLYNRLGGVQASTTNGLTLLKRGEVVGIFPEGEEAMGKPYHQAYCLRPFRTGVAHLSARVQAPIVPVAVVGAEETTRPLFRIARLPSFLRLPFVPVPTLFPLLGPLGLLPLPTKWRIRFGEPVSPVRPYPRTPREHVMHERAEYVRTQVQRLLDTERLRRRTVLFG
jgi:1-acyl-sn-glycerol-3-phosphate acyltransferase